jgi:biofilm protein TabA
MIIDTLSNSGPYESLHPNFKAAFEYLKTQNLVDMEVGTYQIADGVKAIVSDNSGKTAAVAGEKFECHNKNIDIQLCIRGSETIGWKPRANCKSPKAGYSVEKDVTFFNDTPDMFFGLKGGQFAIFYPEDVHAPMIGEGMIKKLVVKVAI